MFTGAREKKKKKKKKKREMDWQLVASYFTVKSTDTFAVYRIMSNFLEPWYFISHIVDKKAENYEKLFIVKFNQNL